MILLFALAETFSAIQILYYGIRSDQLLISDQTPFELKMVMSDSVT